MREAAESGEDDEDDGTADGIEEEVRVVLLFPGSFRIAPDDLEQDEEGEEEDDVDDKVEDGHDGHRDIPFYLCIRMMDRDCSCSFSLFYQKQEVRQAVKK